MINVEVLPENIFVAFLEHNKKGQQGDEYFFEVGKAVRGRAGSSYRHEKGTICALKLRTTLSVFAGFYCFRDF
ncbi:hypothetical protein A8139_18040 [Marinomonas primoryensis]|uniref:Uncharacterized protein n=1 Tax=Marinomonas primoryensis TaxID=178399 RepID=A0A2Z4PVL5_9GAMM|nr:hypothetical protein A8139_18040 [Marinomonas primoryensis]